ncbi:MAG: type II secretion system F family protein [Nanoarchaeota archaeon]
MSLELLKLNIEQEKILVNRLEELYNQYSYAQDVKYKDSISNVINSSINQIKIINKAIPSVINNITLAKSLSDKIKEAKNITTFTHLSPEGKRLVAIDPKYKKDYLKQLNISDIYLKEVKKNKTSKIEVGSEFKKPNHYITLANVFFLNISRKLANKKSFSELKEHLIKGNMAMLLHSYISIILFTTLLSFCFAAILTVFFLFFSISFTSPFIYKTPVEILARLPQVIWIMFIIPILTFLSLYFYPYAERSAVEGQIDYELPFATIQMAAIAGSDIEPSNIFGIIALSKEYPIIKKEAKKLMNQINLYGYDLVTALKNVADSSPSKQWADLLNGIGTTIKSGGDLAKFLNKRAETMLFEYRLKREKATRAAETFMDIYISVVIAAPMLMMLLLIMLSITNLGFNLTVPVLTVLVISAVCLINVIFLTFLHINQKKF